MSGRDRVQEPLHAHAHGPHDHTDTHDSQHEHEHERHHHHGGIRGALTHIFRPHSHDAADSVDDALEASSQGIRAVKLSLLGLGATAVLQLVIFTFSGSVALLADTIHNFSDALTAIPLWIAFVLGRRKATSRYTYGYNRAEGLAGLFIVAMIALSAVLAGVESVRRLLDPQPIMNLGWVFTAGLIGFAGNELVAIYRIRVGRRIGSAALVADGVHARTDGFTSLAVVLGVIGVWLGMPLADPLVGLLITVAILVLLWGTARDIGRRLMDGVEPELVQRVEHAITSVDQVESVHAVRMRWTGHRLRVTAALETRAQTIDEFRVVAAEAETSIRSQVKGIAHVTLTVH